jgi:hypothetical protein
MAHLHSPWGWNIEGQGFHLFGLIPGGDGSVNGLVTDPRIIELARIKPVVQPPEREGLVRLPWGAKPLSLSGWPMNQLGTIIVGHFGHPQKIFQHEPGVARALADAAVCHRLIAQIDPLLWYKARRASADLNVRSSLTVCAEGIFAALGIWPPRCAVSKSPALSPASIWDRTT